MRTVINFLFFLVAFGGVLFVGSGKFLSAGQAVTDGPDEQASRLSIEERKKEAYEILTEILRLKESPDHDEKRARIKKLYREIIDKYPDLKLAQESCLRLVIMAKEEKTPEGDAEAERMYRDFLNRYPNSPLENIMENELKKR